LTFRDCPTNQFGVLGKKGQLMCIGNAGGAQVFSSWAKGGYDLDTQSGSKYDDLDLAII